MENLSQIEVSIITLYIKNAILNEKGNNYKSAI